MEARQEWDQPRLVSGKAFIMKCQSSDDCRLLRGKIIDELSDMRHIVHPAREKENMAWSEECTGPTTNWRMDTKVPEHCDRNAVNMSKWCKSVV